MEPITEPQLETCSGAPRNNNEVTKVDLRRTMAILGITKDVFHPLLKGNSPKKEDGGSCITPQQWWDMREAYNFELLLGGDRIRRIYGVSSRIVAALIQDGTLPCLYTPSGNSRIPEHAVKTWARHNTRVHVGIVARAFGITEEAARSLRATHAICGISHEQETSVCPSLACFEAFLTAHRTGRDFTGTEWLEWCAPENSRGICFKTNAAATRKDTDVLTPALYAAVMRGTMRGVWLPGRKRLAVLESDLRLWIIRTHR